MLDEWFPGGPASDDVARALVPDGWAASPYKDVFPDETPEERVKHEKFMAGLLAKMFTPEARAELPADMLEELERPFRPRPPRDARDKLADLFGLCLWDVISDNHVPRDPARRELDFGSFRGSAGVLAEWADRSLGVGQVRSYTDYYLGARTLGESVDLRPVYAHQFRRLLACECDWEYVFPRLSLVDLSHLKERPDGYDPEREMADERRRAEVAEQQRAFDEARAEDMRAAAGKPPPTVVAAYREVAGRWPRGWPPG